MTMRPIDMYRSIFENAVEGIFQTTPDGRYLDVNPALAGLYGYDSPEDLMRSVTDIAGQLYVDPARRTEFVAAMTTRGEVHDFESEIRRKDGERIWIRENVRAVRDRDGVVLYYEGFVTDVTERRRAEAERARLIEELDRRVGERTRALAESEETLRTLLDVMQESVLLIDLAGRVLAVNEPGARRYGLGVADLEGRCLYELMAPELARTRRERNEDVARTGLPIRWLDSREGMSFETFVYPLSGAAGEVERLAIISRDVTNLRKLEAALHSPTPEA
jgi:urea transport system substrate-binding protein